MSKEGNLNNVATRCQSEVVKATELTLDPHEVGELAGLYQPV